MSEDVRPDADYDRGHLDGRIDARLSGHDAHFTHLNGTTAELVAKVSTLATLVQRLGDQAIAEEATRQALATALRNADEARRSQDNDRRNLAADHWTPVQKIITVLLVLIAASGFLMNLVR